MRRFILSALALAFGIAGEAGAGFVENRATWFQLSTSQRESYAVGLYDGGLVYTAGDRDDEAWVKGFHTCFVRNGLLAPDIAALITKGYDDVANWGETPQSILFRAKKRMCRADIDAERAKSGLKPLP